MNSSPQDSNSDKLASTELSGERLPINRYALFFLPLLIGAIADLLTKHFIFDAYFNPQTATNHMPQYVGKWWIEGVFGIQTSTNPGALFGIGDGYSLFFAAFSIVALIGILVWLFPFKAAFDRWLTFALGLISGGIIGNFYDRVGLGYRPEYPEEIKYNVRDWVLFNLEGVPFFNPWPNFNIADVVLVTGAIMLFMHAIFFVQPPGESDSSSSSSTS